MKLSPIPWLSSIGKAMTAPWSKSAEDAEAAAIKRAEEIQRHEKTLSEAADLDVLARSAGYALFKGMVEARRDALREQLEKGGNVGLLRARLEELKAVLGLVPAGIARMDDARKALVELEDEG